MSVMTWRACASPRIPMFSSRRVTKPRAAKTIRYGLFRPWAAATAPGPATAVSAIQVTSDQVYDREQEDPRDVHEVPVQADELDGLVVLLREPALERLES